MITLSFQITEEAFNLLKEINNKGYAEYKDTEHLTLEDFKKSDDYNVLLKTEEWFLSRNFNGTLNLIYDLSKYGLIESDGESWHPTYIVSDFGKEILNNIV